MHEQLGILWQQAGRSRGSHSRAGRSRGRGAAGEAATRHPAAAGAAAVEAHVAVTDRREGVVGADADGAAILAAAAAAAFVERAAVVGDQAERPGLRRRGRQRQRRQAEERGQKELFHGGRVSLEAGRTALAAVLVEGTRPRVLANSTRADTAPAAGAVPFPRKRSWRPRQDEQNGFGLRRRGNGMGIGRNPRRRGGKSEDAARRGRRAASCRRQSPSPSRAATACAFAELDGAADGRLAQLRGVDADRRQQRRVSGRRPSPGRPARACPPGRWRRSPGRRGCRRPPAPR